MPVTLIALAAATAFASPRPACPAGNLKRHEVRIKGADPGVELFTMRIAAHGRRRGAVVLMHGAGAGGSSIWDLRTDDYSVMRSLACEGFDTYAIDVRGFGGSTMPAAMGAPADANPPAVRAREAVRDLGAAIRYAMRMSKVKHVDLFAWSWGCVVSGQYAGDHPEDIRRLVLFAPVYDRKNPKRHKTAQAWRPAVKKEILPYFDVKREEHAVWVEHIDAMFRFSIDRETLRLPNGPYRDIYGPDAPIWAAPKVKSPTLLIRGDRDPASLGPHVDRLFADLTAAPEKRSVVIAGANHFLMRERRHGQLQRVVIEFLTAPSFVVPVP